MPLTTKATDIGVVMWFVFIQSVNDGHSFIKRVVGFLWNHLPMMLCPMLVERVIEAFHILSFEISGRIPQRI